MQPHRVPSQTCGAEHISWFTGISHEDCAVVMTLNLRLTRHAWNFEQKNASFPREVKNSNLLILVALLPRRPCVMCRCDKVCADCAFSGHRGASESVFERANDVHKWRIGAEYVAETCEDQCNRANPYVCFM